MKSDDSLVSFVLDNPGDEKRILRSPHFNFFASALLQNYILCINCPRDWTGACWPWTRNKFPSIRFSRVKIWWFGYNIRLRWWLQREEEPRYRRGKWKDHHQGACFNNAWSVELPVQDALTVISTAGPPCLPCLSSIHPIRSGKNKETPLSNLRFIATALELALLLLLRPFFPPFIVAGS